MFFSLFSPSPHTYFSYLCGNMKRKDLIVTYLQMKHFIRKYILEFQIANQCVRRRKQEEYYIYGDIPVSGETILELQIQTGRIYLCYRQGHIPRTGNSFPKLRPAS